MSSGEPQFLIYGEDQNDQIALKALIAAILGRPSVNASIRRSPTILSRNAVRKRAPMAREIASFCKSEVRKGKRRVIVVAHRDCDATEPAHLAEATALEREIMAAGVHEVVAATPAWEIESWWMLFPEALARTRGCWRRVDYGSRNVGHIADSKERLVRDLRPTSRHEQNRCPDYAEVDGITVASFILRLGLLDVRRNAQSASFDAFCARIRLVVSTHTDATSS